MRTLPSLLAAAAALAMIAGPVAAQSPAPSTAPAASAAAATPAPSFGAAWTSVPCDDLDIAEDVAKVADCGYVTVPENRAAGTPDTIQVGVVRMRSTSSTPGTPVFVGTGGPGGSGIDFLSKGSYATGSRWLDKWAAVLADRDIIRFTQRGTQFAKPFLECPEYKALDFQAAVNDWSRKELDKQIEAAYKTCFDRLVGEGVDFSGYNTNESAADIVDIKDALGYDKIAYYGESYGTLLGQFLLRNHPEALETIILDGIAPATATLYSQLTDIPAAFDRFAAACDAQASCKKQFGDIGKGLRDVVATLDKAPLKVTAKDADGKDQTLTVGSTAALGWLFINMYSGGADLPLNIFTTAKDPASVAANFVPHPGTTSSYSRMQHIAINCADDPNASIKQFRIKKQPAYLQDFLYDDAIRELLGCKVLDVPQLPDSSDALVTSDIPALLLNGGLDPATAATNGAVVQKGLPNSQNVIFPAGGHIQSGDPCAVAMIASFLKDPKAPLDTSCIPVGQFITIEPGIAKNADGSASLSIPLNRPVWTDKGDGSFVFNGGVIQLQLAVLPPTTTPDQAIKDALKAIAVIEDSQIKDGDKLAGQATRTASVDADVSGTRIYGDAWAFSTPTATYAITFVSPIGDQARPLYAGILAPLTVDPAP